MARINPGQKVKVYSGNRLSTEIVRYGEVIGVSANGKKLLLNERPDFKQLGTRDFHHYRELREVTFMNATSQDQLRPMLADLKGATMITTSSGKRAILIDNPKPYSNA